MIWRQIRTSTQTAEAELIRLALLNDQGAIRTIVQQHNRRLYRVARSILHNDAEAEDALQNAYLRAFSALAGFRGESSLSTWLTRIVANEALQVRRRQATNSTLGEEALPRGADIIPFPTAAQQSEDPERTMAQREICRLVERAIDELPLEFRTVLVARAIEGMSVEDAAESLGIKPETVKTRLHRARLLLKDAIAEHAGPLLNDVFPFEGERCERMTAAVLHKLGC
jgi:RNA polymerase sigma-70 factor (ECF subfamily)